MYEIAKTVSFWIIFTIGTCCGLVGVYYAIGWALKMTMESFNIYSTFIEFMINKYRKKRLSE